MSFLTPFASVDSALTVYLRPSRGRAFGDENSLIDAGYVCVNRLNWFGGTPLDTGLLSGLEAATRAAG